MGRHNDLRMLAFDPIYRQIQLTEDMQVFHDQALPRSVRFLYGSLIVPSPARLIFWAGPAITTLCVGFDLWKLRRRFSRAATWCLHLVCVAVTVNGGKWSLAVCVCHPRCRTHDPVLSLNAGRCLRCYAPYATVELSRSMLKENR